MSGIAADDIKDAGCNIDPENDDASNWIEGGIVSPGGIEGPFDLDVDFRKISEIEDIVMGEDKIMMGDFNPDIDEDWLKDTL